MICCRASGIHLPRMGCMQEGGSTAERDKEPAEMLKEETKESPGRVANSLETAAGICTLKLSRCACTA